MSDVPVIRPQKGPQEAFLSTPADIAIYGGGAGGGKTWALLLEPLRHVANPLFGAVIFRRTSPQITNEGALWDEASKLYPPIGADPRIGDLAYRFPSGSTVGFAHLQHEKDKLNWQGAQVPLICFDELTHFSQSQFWYLLSRNRSMCGVRPYVRGTCNPDADSWVADLIGWWIDQGTGLPIPERAGIIRWFARVNDALVWGDTKGELLARYPDIPPKSLTFIPASLFDNAALMAADPGYRANLMALPLVDRERLLGGNWKIRPAAGLYFQRTWCEVVDAVPSGLVRVRGWDLAATEASEGSDPDWTAGTRIGKAPGNVFYVEDHRRVRGSPGKVEVFVKNTASDDGRGVTISIPQDPGAAGKAQALAFTKLLAGYTVRTSPETGDKVTRFGPFSAQAEAGNVKVVRGPWNEHWFSALEAFPEGKHDDDADSTSRAFSMLIAPPAPAQVTGLRL